MDVRLLIEQYTSTEPEVEARWKLVETAWNHEINPNLLEVKYDEAASMFFIESGPDVLPLGKL